MTTPAGRCPRWCRRSSRGSQYRPAAPGRGRSGRRSAGTSLPPAPWHKGYRQSAGRHRLPRIAPALSPPPPSPRHGSPVKRARWRCHHADPPAGGRSGECRSPPLHRSDRAHRRYRPSAGSGQTTAPDYRPERPTSGRSDRNRGPAWQTAPDHRSPEFAARSHRACRPPTGSVAARAAPAAVTG